MRICMILSTPLPPCEGIGFYVWNLSKYLTSLGHHVQLITRGGRSQPMGEVVDGITIWRPAFFPAYPFHVHLHGLFVNRLIQRIQPQIDLFHIHSPLPPVIATSRPIVLTMHSAIRHDVKATAVDSIYTAQMKLQAPISYGLEERLLRQAGRVTVVSPQVAAALSSYSHAPSEIKATWNGVDTALFSPGITDDRAERLILSVGRLAPGKGMEDLIHAATMINQRIGPTRFIIVGDGLLRQPLEKMIADHNLAGSISLLGHVSDRSQLADLYRRASLFVLLSHHEGLPTVMLEAMSCGCPVVATDVGGIPYVITPGENGMLVPIKAPKQVADTICDLLLSPQTRHELGRRARQTVEERFAWNIVGQDYIAHYQALVSGDRPWGSTVKQFA